VPLLFTEPFGETGLLGVWEITESLPDLSRAFRGSPADLTEAEGIAHPQKLLEFLASRVLLRHLTEAAGLPYQGLTKDEFGKPTLHGHAHWHLSLTHGTRLAAGVLHPTHPVGIDLEQPRESLRRVAPRVLSPAELAHAAGNLDRLTVYWTAKEAMYKLYGKRGLFFREKLFVAPFEAASGEALGWIQHTHARCSCRIQLHRFAETVLAVALAETAAHDPAT
jgi:phosphopantetheinyl transferase